VDRMACVDVRGIDVAALLSEERERAAAAIAGTLRRFTPGVEPARYEPGVFWLDARGLDRLYPSLEAWARAVHRGLKEAGFEASVAAGTTRFAAYALARSRRGVTVFEDPALERAAAREAPLERIAMDPEARDALAKLGIRTVGQFIDLPPEGIAARFGPALHRLHRLASGKIRMPIEPERPEPPAAARIVLEHPESDASRLLALIERILEKVLDQVARRALALAEMKLILRFERIEERVETVRPASPAVDAGTIMNLIRLRVEALGALPDAVAEIEIAALAAPAAPRQLHLREIDARPPRRDLAAANRALARVRARLGAGAIERARLREGHLPEGRFRWEPMETLAGAAPRPSGVEAGAESAAARLIRRIHARPVPLPPRPRHEPDGWMLRGLEQGPVARVAGPYIVSGGWWNRPVHREYHFAETQKGELLWVYYDRARRLWYLHGRVE